MLPTVVQETFTEKVLMSTKPILVKFTADWCQPCKQMTQILEDLTPELGDHVSFVEVDIEANPTLANNFGVRGLPTLMLFKSGRVLANMNGLSPKPKVRSWIVDQLGL